MRHLRLVIVAVVAVAALAILPADHGRATPGLGGTPVFSVQGIGPAHDVSAAAMPPYGTTCTSADILAAPFAVPTGPCAARVAPAPAGPVPWGATSALPDLGLNVFGPFSDDLQDFSLGEMLGVAADYDFSVGPAPANAGVTVGATIVPVCAPFFPNVTTEAAALQAQGDIFTTAGVPAGCNTQFTDEAALGLIAPNAFAPGVPPLDNIDALGEFTGAAGPCTAAAGLFPTICAAYTLSGASASLGFIAPDAFTGAVVTGATILAQPGTLAAPPALPGGCPGAGIACAAVGYPSLGLAMGDDVDALCWFDVVPNGAPDLPIGVMGPGSPGDIYLYSLTPASPSAPALGGPASIIRVGGGIAGASVAVTAATLGLLPTDNLDALICHAFDGDGDLVPVLLDNCPTVGNPTQLDVDLDGIGDACDTEGPSPNANGLGGADDCTDGVDNDGDGLTDGADTTCFLDSDGDGVPDAMDNCPFVPNPGQADGDGDFVGTACDNCPVTSNTGQANADGDGQGDACDNCLTVATPWVVPPGDTDCDAWTDADEAAIGTDFNDNCGPAKWPPDFDDSLQVDISDVNMLAPPVFFTTSGAWFPRRDIVPDVIIDIVDVNRLAPPMFFATCTP